MSVYCNMSNKFLFRAITMLPLRCSAAIGISERQLPRHHDRIRWKRLRPFHISAQHRADNPPSKSTDNGQTAQINAPQKGPSRQQRSAMISEEIKMIQRDHPKPSFAEPDPNTLRPAGARLTVDPEAVGANVDAERMGEAGKASSRSAIDSAPVDPVSPQIQAERAKEAQPGVLAPSVATQPIEGGSLPVSESKDVPQPTVRPGLSTSDQVEHQPIAEPVRNTNATREQLLHGGNGTSTIAGGNYGGVIIDHLHQVAEPGKQKSRNLEQTRRKMSAKMLVLLDPRKDGKTREQPNRKGFKPVPDSIQDGLVNSMVGGFYHHNLGREAEQHTSHPVLSHISEQTSLNGTYHASDATKFLNKVSGLLPGAPPSKQPK